MYEMGGLVYEMWVLLLHLDIRNRAFAAGEDTLCTTDWQWGIEDRIANLMAEEYLTRLGIHTQQQAVLRAHPQGAIFLQWHSRVVLIAEVGVGHPAGRWGIGRFANG